LKHRKILYVNFYTHYSSFATHSALNFNISDLLASLYSQSQVGSLYNSFSNSFSATTWCHAWITGSYI